MRSTLSRFTANTEPVSTVSAEVWQQETRGLGDEDRVIRSGTSHLLRSPVLDDNY